MTRVRRTPAAEQFKALGIPEADWTPAMTLAVKQNWSGLPVDEKVADLRNRLAAVETVATPSTEEIVANNLAATGIGDRDAAEVEAKRLARNAGVTAWRSRKQLQAALDARDLKFKALRASRKAPADAAADDEEVTV